MEALANLRCSQGGCSSSYGAGQTSFRRGGDSHRTSSAAFVTIRRSRLPEESGGQWGVVSVRAKGRKNMMPGRAPPAPTPTMPKLDGDDNPKFVIFIRTKNVPRWYPLSVVTGGTTAKLMLAAMGNEWGRRLYEGTLTRNIAGVIYKDEKTIRQTAFKTYPVLKSASGYMYGYKVIDKKNPKSALTSSDVLVIPPQEELVSFVDKVKQGFANFTSGVKDTFGSISPIAPEPEAEPEAGPVSGSSSKKSSKKKGK